MKEIIDAIKVLEDSVRLTNERIDEVWKYLKEREEGE